MDTRWGVGWRANEHIFFTKFSQHAAITARQSDHNHFPLLRRTHRFDNRMRLAEGRIASNTSPG